MTALPNWGTLTKSTTDSTTVDEAIATAIDNHDADASAHLGAGASLAAHKAFEVIDHPAGSVVGDKIERTRIINTDFNGMGGMYKYHNAVAYFGAAQVYTDATTGFVSQLSGAPNVWEPLDWTKASYMRFVVKLGQDTHQEALLGVGCDDLGDGISGYGFKVVDNALYAYHAYDSGSGAVFTTTEIAGITLTNWHTYEVILDPVAGTLTFFIDGVQVAQFTSGLPTDTEDNALMLQIKTTENTAKYIYASNFNLQVEY